MLPWIEKYRPTKLNNIIGHEYVIKMLKNSLNKNDIPHLLFYGSPGTGKTTTILAFCRELFGPKIFYNRVLELNASNDRGINVVRTQIITFAKTQLSSPDPDYPSPNYKILILDEADAMTIDAQTALRKVMEEYSYITKFCIICNYIDKIIPAIISRCMEFKFFPLQNQTTQLHIKKIIEKEFDYEIDNNIINTISIISNGDLRKAINIVQNFKYIKNSNDINVLYDLENIIPDKILQKIIQNIKQNSLIEWCNNFHILGYSVKTLCEQLIYNFNDNKKYVFNITKYLQQLINGCDDYIILMNLYLLLL